MRQKTPHLTTTTRTNSASGFSLSGSLARLISMHSRDTYRTSDFGTLTSEVVYVSEDERFKAAGSNRDQYTRANGRSEDLNDDIPLHVLDKAPAGIYPIRTQIANVCFVAAQNSGDFVLVDAGLLPAGKRILEAAEERFGASARPLAIVLTHGHFDHVGAISTLLEHWDVPVYAHPLELPYLTGESSYPPANPGAGGGLMSLLSPLYPRDPIDLGDHVQPLPRDGSVPGLSEWGWVHTPGHTPGHVSLFREQDGALIAGDAFTTVKQESLVAVLTQHAEVHGPPAYFTMDWDAAWNSVRLLASLDPTWVITGHGLAMSGPSLREGLSNLAAHFDELVSRKSQL